MNNEKTLLAMSLLVITEAYENSVWISISENLKLLREYNTIVIYEDDGDWEQVKKEIVKDEELQKVIIAQEKILKRKSF